MVAVRPFPKVCLHGKLAISAFRPLVDYFMAGKGQLPYLYKALFLPLPMLYQHLVLAFAA